MSEDNYSAKEENDMSQNEIRKQRLFSNSNSFRYPGGYLSIDKYKFSLNHYYESNRSAARSSVGFIVSGRVELRSRYVSLKLSAGDVFYIPSNEKYSSIWTGTPDIEFYGMYSIPPLDVLSETGRFGLGKLMPPEGEDMTRFFAEMYRLMASGEADKRLHAVGMYYDFAGKVIGSLRPRENETLPPALGEIIGFIERDSVSDISVPELSERFRVSESTLYHLFRRYLGTTPVNYRNELRIERSLELLESGMSVERTAEEVGFNSSVYFRSVFMNSTGMTPSEYRKSHSDRKV